MSYDRYGKTSHKDAFGSTYIAWRCGAKPATSTFANTRPDLFGPDLLTFMKRAARGFTRISMFGEGLPNIENRIELASDKDEFGMPLGRLIHSFDRRRPRCGMPTSQKGRRPPRPRAPRRSGCGRAPYSDDPPARAARSWVRARRTRWSIASARATSCRTSTWRGPASSRPGASNPTYTILAVSLRGAEQLATKWSTVAG